MKHVVLYVGHMYKPFWTKKIWPGWQGGSGKVKIWPRMGLTYIHFWLRSLLDAPKCVKDSGNGPQMIPPNCPWLRRWRRGRWRRRWRRSWGRVCNHISLLHRKTYRNLVYVHSIYWFVYLLDNKFVCRNLILQKVEIISNTLIDMSHFYRTQVRS